MERLEHSSLSWNGKIRSGSEAYPRSMLGTHYRSRGVAYIRMFVLTRDPPPGMFL